MKQGALAVFDALGFKGIWKENEPEGILEKLDGLARATETHLDRMVSKNREDRLLISNDPNHHFHRLHATFLSDTIAIGLWLKPSQSRMSNRSCIDFLSGHVGNVLKRSSESDPVFAYRGAISFGDFEIGSNDRFIVGAAVDDAAEHHELAQGAFVWLTPTAVDIFETDKTESPVHHLLQYSVPLKGGSRFDTYVVTPFGYCNTSKQCDDVKRKILESFSSKTLDVRVKYQETARFLDFARNEWVNRNPSGMVQESEGA